MPIFEIQGPDGQTYEVDAPDENSAVSAFQSQMAPSVEPTWADTAKDVGASLASGVGRGAAGLVGLPGTIGNAINDSLSWATGMQPLPASPFSSEGAQSSLSTVTGGASDYQPQTTAGDYAGTVGEFLPGAAIGGANVANLLRFGVLPGVASEGAGQLTEGTSIEPYARVAAALAAPAIPALASRAISPFSGSISPERTKAINSLRNEGVPITAGQATGSKGLQYMESELGGSRAASVMDDQARAFTEAATQRAGMQGIATSDNMAANAQRLGQGFESISARNAVQADPQFGNDLGRVLREYDRVLPSAQREVVNNMADDILAVTTGNNGVIPGEVYQATRSRLGRMAQSARNSDPEYANALRGLRNTLDDAMARSVSPDDAAEWSRLRNEYGNMKVLEKAATGAGESAAMGLISPAKLRQAATTGRQSGYARGQGDFDELARSGQAVMSPLPNSGTAGRVRAQNLGTGVLAGGGAIAGGLPGMVAGLLAPQVAGATLMSRPVQSYLTNQIAPNMSMIDPRTLTVIQSLISNQGQ